MNSNLLPPLIVSLIIAETGKMKIRLWLPLFLLLPFVYIVVLFFDLLLIPLLMVLAPKGRKLDCARVALIEPFRILNATKGLTVEVNNPIHQVFISVR